MVQRGPIDKNILLVRQRIKHEGALTFNIICSHGRS